MLVALSEKVSIRPLLAPATSCLTALGCAFARMHMVSTCLWTLKDLTPGGRWRAWRWWYFSLRQGCCHCNPVTAATAAGANATEAAGCSAGGGLLLWSVLLPWRVRGGEWCHQPCRGGTNVPPPPRQRSTFPFRNGRRVHRQTRLESPCWGTGCCTSKISWALPGWSQSPYSCGPSGL